MPVTTFKLLWLDGAKRITANAWLRSHFEDIDNTSSFEGRQTESPICLTSTATFKEDFFCLPVNNNNSVTCCSIEELKY